MWSSGLILWLIACCQSCCCGQVEVSTVQSVVKAFASKGFGFNVVCGSGSQTFVCKLILRYLLIQSSKNVVLCCYEIIFGLVRIDCEAFFELRTSCTRGHHYKLLKHHSSISVRSNFFAERVINAWNGLPADHIQFISQIPKFTTTLCFNC